MFTTLKKGIWWLFGFDIAREAADDIGWECPHCGCEDFRVDTDGSGVSSQCDSCGRDGPDFYLWEVVHK